MNINFDDIKIGYGVAPSAALQGPLPIMGTYDAAKFHRKLDEASGGQK